MSQLTPVPVRLTISVLRAGFVVALVLACSLATASAASATSTVGQLFTPTYTTCGGGTFLQTGVASGSSYTVATPGAITSWSFETNTAVVPNLELKVARPAGADQYTIVAQSAAGTQKASAVNTYAVDIPVSTGDVIGIYEGGGGCYSATVEADTYAWVSSTNEGLGTATYEALTKGKIPVSAIVTVPPGATTSPASSLNTSSAILNGVVGPEESRTAYFQYGTSASYGTATPHQDIGASGGPSSASAAVSGLSPATTYHFRLVTENAGGVSYGADQTFTTPAPPPIVPPTSPPVEKGKPLVNTRTGGITIEYAFPEPGQAQETAQVIKGASLARLQETSPFGLSDALSAFEAEKASKKCRKGYVRKGKKCVNNAPVPYGQARLAVPTAGTYKLLITPSAGVLAALKKGKTPSVRLTLVFTPAGTTDHIVETASATVHLKLKKPGHKRHATGKK